MYELMRRNRFLVKFPDEIGIPEWWVVKCTTPKVLKNGTITVEVRFPLIQDNSGKQPKLFDMKIEYLESTGCVLSSYQLLNCEFKKITIDDLSYEDDNICSSKMVIKYEKCIPDEDIVKIII